VFDWLKTELPPDQQWQPPGSRTVTAAAAAARQLNGGKSESVI